MEIDSVSVRVDFNSHREKIETNSALVLHASLTGLFLGCVFELLTLDWMVWEATNEDLQFWHKGWKQLCCYTPTPSTAKNSPPLWALQLERCLIESARKTKAEGRRKGQSSASLSGVPRCQLKWQHTPFLLEGNIKSFSSTYKKCGC